MDTAVALLFGCTGIGAVLTIAATWRAYFPKAKAIVEEREDGTLRIYVRTKE